MTEVIPKDKIVIITDGYYEDAFDHGIYKTLKEDWIKLFPEQEKEGKFLGFSFCSWLIEQKFVEKLDSYNLFLGGDNIRDMWVEEK